VPIRICLFRVRLGEAKPNQANLIPQRFSATCPQTFPMLPLTTGRLEH
jgi:hypothetical protein